MPELSWTDDHNYLDQLASLWRNSAVSDTQISLETLFCFVVHKFNDTVLAKSAKRFRLNKLSLKVNKTNYILFHSHQKKLLTQIKLPIDKILIEQTDKTTFVGIIIIEKFNLHWSHLIT